MRTVEQWTGQVERVLWSLKCVAGTRWSGRQEGSGCGHTWGAGEPLTEVG